MRRQKTQPCIGIALDNLVCPCPSTETIENVWEGAPLPGVAEFLGVLRAKGYKVVIVCRLIEPAIASVWLAENKLPIDAVEGRGGQMRFRLFIEEGTIKTRADLVRVLKST